MQTRLSHPFSTYLQSIARALGAVALLVLVTGNEAKAVENSIANMIVDHQIPAWTSVASGCTLDEDSLTAQLSGATLESTAGESTVRCNVTDLLPNGTNWNTLDVTYLDPDGSATDTQVVVELHRTSDAPELVSVPFNNASRLLPRTDFILTSFNSNTVSGTTRTTHSQLFSHNFDFINSAYYVTIKVKRASTATATPAAFIVRLYTTVFIGG